MKPLVALIFLSLFLVSCSNGNVSYDKFIDSNPVDLTQINEISKFRSCAGHDYSGYNIDGEKEGESSMKHYNQKL